MQLVKKEMALAIALAQKRFPEGSATGDRRHAAEEEFAQALAKLGRRAERCRGHGHGCRGLHEPISLGLL